ncbi:MAG: FecR domain-containing protein [Sedimentisphaerales bacterium]|nr:FecR domain-containing protein [Sedimentisphaerales bacterium]
MSKPPFPNMDELLQRLLDGNANQEEVQHLADAILADPQVRDYYIDSMVVAAVVRRSSHVTGDLSKADLIRALSAAERRRSSTRSKLLLYTIAAALLIGGVVFFGLTSFVREGRGPVIGVLVEDYCTQWQGRHPSVGGVLRAGPYYLRSGLARMGIGAGASLLLEGPCRLELKGPMEVDLRSGRLVATVEAQPKGFQVRTPTALITDMGTQFGVIAHPDGSTEAHVLKGQIRVTVDTQGAEQSRSILVNEGSAAVVGADRHTLQGGLAARVDLFVLEIPPASQPANLKRRISLADIVGGGNGRGTGTLERGIDLVTGQPFTGLPNTIRWVRQDRFQPVRSKGVDSVFIPYGASGRVTISTTGLVFTGCPRTRGSYYGGPANSGRFFDILTQQVFVTRLNGVTYGTPAHPAMTLHPNAGITFDLDEIRRDNPDVLIGRFTATCGIPRDLPHPRFSHADVWVLLDGQLSVHLNFPQEQNPVYKIDIPIPAHVRFLTLMATCSGRADYSWIVFGDPFLGEP